MEGDRGGSLEESGAGMGGVRRGTGTWIPKVIRTGKKSQKFAQCCVIFCNGVLIFQTSKGKKKPVQQIEGEK